MRNELKNDGRQILYHIISRLDATGAQIRPKGAPKSQLSSQVAKFAG